MSEITSIARPTELFDRLHSSAVTREDLQEAAQLAVKVEFTTIPVYLTGLYSMINKDCFAYQALRSVVMEEMFHVNQAANILVALGGEPRFTGIHTPTYPGYLPQANPATTPYVGLYRASTDVFANVYAAIETPAPAGAPPQGKNYDSIAQLYDALKVAVAEFKGVPFQADWPVCRQRTNIYLGKFGGDVKEVTDIPTALYAVNQIVKQGEGSVPVASPLNPIEQFGAYNHYGQRTDGTYGPILGTPFELSHFIKFRKVSLDTASFPATYPITSDPRIEAFSYKPAIALANLFNKSYSVMLQSLEQSFKKPTQRDPSDPYFGVVMSIMHQVLPNLADALMSMPAHANGDASVGPNAAPTWVYHADAHLHGLAGELKKVIEELNASGDGTPAIMEDLAEALNGLLTLMSKVPEVAVQ